MATQTALFGKITSLLSLFRLLIVFIGQKIGFNAHADALESPPRTNVSWTQCLRACLSKISLFQRLSTTIIIIWRVWIKRTPFEPTLRAIGLTTIEHGSLYSTSWLTSLALTLICYRNRVPQPILRDFQATVAIETLWALSVHNYYIRTIRRRRRRRRRRRTHPFYQQRPFNATTSPYKGRALAGVIGVSAIHLVAHVKEPQSASLGRILQNQLLTAPALLFWADLTLITSVVSAWFGSALKGPAGDNITTQLESIAR